MRLRNAPCWFMGHVYRHQPGDKDIIVCQRCGHRELLAVKQMRDKAARPGA